MALAYFLDSVEPGLTSWPAGVGLGATLREVPPKMRLRAQSVFKRAIYITLRLEIYTLLVKWVFLLLQP